MAAARCKGAHLVRSLQVVRCLRLCLETSRLHLRAATRRQSTACFQNANDHVAKPCMAASELPHKALAARVLRGAGKICSTWPAQGVCLPQSCSLQQLSCRLASKVAQEGLQQAWPIAADVAEHQLAQSHQQASAVVRVTISWDLRGCWGWRA